MAVCTGACVFWRSIAAITGANWRVPVSTRTRPSSVSNAVQPENCEANQVLGATSTGPPVQKNLASSGLFPRIVANFAEGFSAIGNARYLIPRHHANRSAMSKHPTIRLKPKEGRRLRAGAPWAFSNEIAMSAAAKALKPGSVVNVEGDDGHALGTGYFNPNSLIAIRLLDARPDVVPDAEFFAARLDAALALRDRIYREPFYRLVHAEGDFLPGLTIDRFDDTYVVQITTAGMEALRAP